MCHLNKTMKYLIICFSIIFISSCQSDEIISEETLVSNDHNLNSVQKELQDSSQFFIIETNKESIITGEYGTKIYINPEDLKTISGEKIAKTIKLELKELLTQSDFVKEGVQTVSNGDLLVSGGAYYINIYSNNEPVTLKENKTLKVEFPVITNEDMYLFYGERDSSGNMNWNETSIKLETKVEIKGETIGDWDTGFIIDKEKAELNIKTYKAVNINQFGWINCDRLFKEGKRVNLVINFSNDTLGSAAVYLIFKGINSVVIDHYLSINNKLVSGFSDVPVGYDVRLLSYTVKNGKIYSYMRNFTILENENIRINFKETSIDKLSELTSIN